MLYGQGLVNRVRAVPGRRDRRGAGRRPARRAIEDLISLAPEPSQVVTIANYGAARSGARLTGGGADSQPMKALAETAELLEQNKLVVKVQTFPLERAAEAHRISEAGHVRGKLVLLP